jgi:hypothetical protein
MAKKSNYLAFVCLLLFSACFEREEPIEPFPRGDNMEAEVELGSDYRYQAYFDLSTGNWLNKKRKNTWDIAWSASDSSDHIEINSGHGMWAAFTPEEDLNKITDTTGLEFKFDWPGGHPDSLALTGWEELKGCWVLDMGFDVNGLHTGFVKVQFEKVSDNKLKMRYAELGSNQIYENELEKDNRYLSVFYSFRNHTSDIIEPPKEEWDLVFRQYHHYFGAPEFITYQVTGVFTHPQIAVAVDSGDFESYTAEMANQLFLTNRRDRIGYDWKDFTLNTGTYTIATQKIFVIKDQEGFLYKLHFVDFYNDQGESGTPAFVYKRL